MFTRLSRSQSAACCAAAVLALGALSSEAAGRYSWFDEPLEADLFARALEPSVRFELMLRRASGDEGRSRWFSDERYAAFGERAQHDRVRVYGEWNSDRAQGAGPTAFERLARSLLEPAAYRRSLLGVSWEHRLDRLHSITLAAEYGENSLLSPPLRDRITVRDTLDARAILSWTGRFSGEGRPSLTSSVFLGDETAREPGLQRLGRSYYGFALGGEMTLLDAHTPYVSLRLQRSDYDTGDPLDVAQEEYRTLLSAGWKWQIQRGLSLQAEASYDYSGKRLDLLAPERSRLFFGTRFDFR